MGREMKTLQQLTEHVWYLPHDEPTDRPVLGYVRGSRYALAVDAGASPVHVECFYRELERAGLPLPDMTAITHWHWDHTLGMGSVHGATIACAETNRLLREERAKAAAGPAHWDAMREDAKGFELEYPVGSKPEVVLAAIEFSDTLRIDLGGETVVLTHVEAPHTPDSVLVRVVEDRVLFMGDAACADYDAPNAPVLDLAKLEILAHTVREAGCERFLHGHWEPLDATEIEEDFEPLQA